MPYINTIDINGEVYNLGNLTDGYYTVDLPTLGKDDVFILQGDVVDNLVGSQQNKPLSANQGRVLNTKINTEVQNSTNRDATITDNLNAEISRATTRENALDNKVDNEISRAEQAETDLDTKIDSETERAVGAENTLSTNLNAEVERATNKENDLNTKIETETSRANQAESDLNTAIEAESSRSQLAESTLVTNLNNEVSRATAKETEIDTNISSLREYVNTQDTATLTSAKSYADERYTNEEKEKLGGIEAEANKYIHPSYTEQSSGLYKIVVDSTGHIYAVTAVTKDDIVELGIPAQDTVYTLPAATDTEIGGVKISADYATNVSDDVAASTSAVKSVYDALVAYVDEKIAELSGGTT